jgi:hypothetical protein
MASIGLERIPTAGRLEVIPLANAAAVVALAAYVICAALSFVAPDLLMGVLQSWAHSLALEPLRTTGPSFRPIELVVGLVTFGGTVWLATAAVARLYNAWTHS